MLRLPPHEGDALKKGDRVAEIDPADHALRRDEAGEAWTGSGPTGPDAGGGEEDIQRARAQVDEAKAAAAAAAADLQRIKEVFAKQSVTPKQMDDTRAVADRTAAVLAAAEQNLAKLLAGSRKEEIRLAQAQVDLAKVRLAQAEKALADCTVLRPWTVW